LPDERRTDGVTLIKMRRLSLPGAHACTLARSRPRLTSAIRPAAAENGRNALASWREPEKFTPIPKLWLRKPLCQVPFRHSRLRRRLRLQAVHRHKMATPARPAWAAGWRRDHKRTCVEETSEHVWLAPGRLEADADDSPSPVNFATQRERERGVAL